MENFKKITIIIPTRNEERYIDKCLNSVLKFERLNEYWHEILVIDGLSNDKTKEIIKSFCVNNANIKLIDNPSIIQASALNIGIRLSQGDYIMRLDAHCVYPSEYFQKLIDTAVSTGADNVGGIIITHPGGIKYGAQLVQALTTHKFGVGNSGFRTGASEGLADTVPFGFFERDIFNKIGLFDEKLIRCQDYEFNRRIIKNGGKIWMNPHIQTDYFNQPTLWKFLIKQITKEAPYNPYMWYLHRYTFTYRHAVTGVFTFFLIIGLILSFLFTWSKILYLGVMSFYLLLAIVSSVQQASRYKQILHVFTLPISFFLFHFLHGTGIWIGIFKLILGISPVQKNKL